MGQNIITLVDAGPDAFTNLFDVTFTPPTIIKDYPAGYDGEVLANDMTIRIQNFPFPTIAPDTYSINYKAIQLKRIKPKFTGQRKLQLSFRVDSNWYLYTKLKAWKKIFQDEYDSNINFTQLSNTDITKLGSIVVKSYNSNTSLSTIEADSTTAPKWTFKQVICKNVVEPTFTRESANPVIIQADFIFGEYLTPYDN